MDWTQACLISLFVIIGVPFNMVIILVSFHYRRSMPPSNILVTNLAIADLIFLLHGPIKIDEILHHEDFRLGEFLCKSNNSGMVKPKDTPRFDRPRFDH